MADNRSGAGRAKTASGLNILVGAWLIIAPWAIGYSGVSSAMWNDVIVGTIVVILAGVRAAAPGRYAALSWTNVALGAWLLIAPFILQYVQVAGALWNDLIVGATIAVLSWASAIGTAEAHV